ncbi:MAG: methyltransferase [Micrococcaceae bacterium]
MKELNLHVAAHGGVFAGTKYDIGTRAFLETLKGQKISGHVADLGSGNGIVSAYLLSQYSDITLDASDDSYFAYLSTQDTLKLNELTGKVQHDFSLSTMTDNSYDHIFLNPPFHAGTRVDPTSGITLIEAAAKKLKPQGSLWCVYNSMLNRYYMPAFTQYGGHIEHLTQTKKFIVKRVHKGA